MATPSESSTTTPYSHSYCMLGFDVTGNSLVTMSIQFQPRNAFATMIEEGIRDMAPSPSEFLFTAEHQPTYAKRTTNHAESHHKVC